MAKGEGDGVKVGVDSGALSLVREGAEERSAAVCIFRAAGGAGRLGPGTDGVLSEVNGKDGQLAVYVGAE